MEWESNQHRNGFREPGVIPLPVAGICISSYCETLLQHQIFEVPYYVAKGVALEPFIKPPVVDANQAHFVYILKMYEELRRALIESGRRVERWGHVPIIGRVIQRRAYRRLLTALDGVVALPSARTSMRAHISALFGVHEAILYAAYSLMQARGQYIRTPLPYILLTGFGRTFATAGIEGVSRFRHLQGLLSPFRANFVPVLLIVLPDQEAIRGFRSSGDEQVLVEILRDLVDLLGTAGFIKFLMGPKGLLLKGQVKRSDTRWCNSFANARLEVNFNDFVRHQAKFVELLSLYITGGENYARELVAEATRDSVILVGGPMNLTMRTAEATTAPALLKYMQPINDMRCGVFGVVSTRTQAALLGYTESTYVKIREDLPQTILYNVVKVTVEEALGAYCKYLSDVGETQLAAELCGY